MSGQNGLEATTEIIDPKKAAEYLATRATQRDESTGVESHYARLMEAGKWSATGEAIQFDTEGRLVNGQHRLNALIAAGVTLPFVVVRGVPPSAQEDMDQVYARTPGHVLQLAGHEGDSDVAGAALKWLWTYEKTGSIRSSKLKPSNSEVRRMWDEHPAIDRSVRLARGARNKALQGSQSVWAFSHYVFARQDPEAAELFMEGVVDGVGLAKDEIRKVLRERMLREAAKRTALSYADTGWLIFRSWAAYKAGQNLSYLQLPSDGGTTKLYDIGPVPGIREVRS